MGEKYTFSVWSNWKHTRSHYTVIKVSETEILKRWLSSHLQTNEVSCLVLVPSKLYVTVLVVFLCFCVFEVVSHGFHRVKSQVLLIAVVVYYGENDDPSLTWKPGVWDFVLLSVLATRRGKSQYHFLYSKYCSSFFTSLSVFLEPWKWFGGLFFWMLNSTS